MYGRGTLLGWAGNAKTPPPCPTPLLDPPCPTPLLAPPPSLPHPPPRPSLPHAPPCPTLLAPPPPPCPTPLLDPPCPTPLLAPPPPPCPPPSALTPLVDPPSLPPLPRPPSLPPPPSQVCQDHRLRGAHALCGAGAARAPRLPPHRARDAGQEDGEDSPAALVACGAHAGPSRTTTNARTLVVDVLSPLLAVLTPPIKPVPSPPLPPLPPPPPPSLSSPGGAHSAPIKPVALADPPCCYPPC